MDIQLLIGGASIDAENARTFDRQDPVTGKRATRAAAANAADATKAADAAANAFAGWSQTSPGERRKLLLKAADVMQSKIAEFTTLMIEETGATGAWAGFNVMLAADMLREAASLTTMVQGSIIPSNKPDTTALAVRNPVGVCLGIAPWNAPVILGTRAVATALACGNTVILKASEMCPGTHMLIGTVLAEAGLPDGVINVVTNAPEDASQVVSTLIAHPAVKHVNFTGSTTVGKIVAKLAAEALTPVLLELGGKAPLVVLDDAHIEGAVNAAIFGCFMNQGQICMSTERIIVDEKIADAFIARLSERASGLSYGNPREQVMLGSLISLDAAERMDALIADATALGAKKLSGGDRQGSIVPATLLDNVTPKMRIYHEESFGPVKSIIRVSGEEEAIRVANDTEYGLAAAVFTADVQRGLRVAAKLESGICHINGPTVGDEAQMPFGGVKSSGYGRFGGMAGIEAFTTLRWVTIEDPEQHYPF